MASPSSSRFGIGERSALFSFRVRWEGLWFLKNFGCTSERKVVSSARTAFSSLAFSGLTACCTIMELNRRWSESAAARAASKKKPEETRMDSMDRRLSSSRNWDSAALFHPAQSSSRTGCNSNSSLRRDFRWVNSAQGLTISCRRERASTGSGTESSRRDTNSRTALFSSVSSVLWAATMRTEREIE